MKTHELFEATSSIIYITRKPSDVTQRSRVMTNEGIVDRIRALNYDRLAKRSDKKSSASLDGAMDHEFSDPDRSEHEDQFMKHADQRDDRLKRAAELRHGKHEVDDTFIATIVRKMPRDLHGYDEVVYAAREIASKLLGPKEANKNFWYDEELNDMSDGARKVLSMYFVDEGLTEAFDTKQRARLDDLIDAFRQSVDPANYNATDPGNIIIRIRREFGDKIADRVEAGAGKMHFPRDNHTSGHDPLGWKRPVDRVTGSGKMYKQDSDYRKNTIAARYRTSGRSSTNEEFTLKTALGIAPATSNVGSREPRVK